MPLKITSQTVLSISLVVMGIGGTGTFAFADGWDPNSRASNMGSIENTRHNLTLSYSTGGFAATMDQARNNYGAICVYCHTPHGANKQIAAPLWNRTVNPGEYTIYDKPTTLGLEGRLSLPGPSSLTCLSCHDGTIAIDSVLNMPGSGLYGNNEVGTANISFLDNWRNESSFSVVVHATLGGPAGAGGSVAPGTCANGDCHGDDQGIRRADFRLFVLGTDLRDDHIVGVTYPTTFGPGVDYNEPQETVPGKWAFFDSNGSRYAEKYEVRLYDSGAGPAVECASCHDPHGIPSDTDNANSEFIPSFLRISNSTANNNGIGGPSGLCLTCHAK